MYIDDHILYHGAVLSVPEPLAHVGRPDLDFGPGFYVTNDRDQAIKWANLSKKTSATKSASSTRK